MEPTLESQLEAWVGILEANGIKQGTAAWHEARRKRP